MLVGTIKGAFVLRSDGSRTNWEVGGPYFPGRAIYALTYDGRNGRNRLWAAVNSSYWGSYLSTSDDFGKTWTEPEAYGVKFPEGADASVKQIWQIALGHPDQPDTLYCGVEPAALFRSDDAGASWSLNSGLYDHPHRPQWMPGGGGLCLHSILVDPRKPKHLVIGISAVGAFESRDAGRSWTMENRGVRAGFLPNPYPEWGQCVHKIAWDASADGSVFQQNHTGTYHRGPDGGAWTEVTKGLPSDFGFPIAAHPDRKGTAFVTPLIGAMNRVFHKGQMAVWKTGNAGKSWRKATKGLPGPNAYLGVLREGMSTDAEDPLGVYVGTNTGQLFASRDEGESWKIIADFLPPIMSVSTGMAR